MSSSTLSQYTCLPRDSGSDAVFNLGAGTEPCALARSYGRSCSSNLLMSEGENQSEPMEEARRSLPPIQQLPGPGEGLACRGGREGSPGEPLPKPESQEEGRAVSSLSLSILLKWSLSWAPVHRLFSRLRSLYQRGGVVGGSRLRISGQEEGTLPNQHCRGEKDSGMDLGLAQ